jgi:secondary thiamine-phosphate synthase enzyme
MTIINDSLRVETSGQNDMLDLTPRLALLLSKHRLKNGHMIVFVSGSTAGLTTIEFENGLKQDFGALMDRVAPRNIRYHHEETWNDGNGHSHVRASLLGPSLTIPFANSALLLGTWQQVVLVDFDVRHRDRTIAVQLVGE